MSLVQLYRPELGAAHVEIWSGLPGGGTSQSCNLSRGRALGSGHSRSGWLQRPQGWAAGFGLFPATALEGLVWLVWDSAALQAANFSLLKRS